MLRPITSECSSGGEAQAWVFCFKLPRSFFMQPGLRRASLSCITGLSKNHFIAFSPLHPHYWIRSSHTNTLSKHPIPFFLSVSNCGHMYLHHFSIHICFPYWWVRWWKGLWCKMSSKPVPQCRQSIAICWINKSGSKYLQIRWWVCFTVRRKVSHFPSHVGQAGLRGEREPEGTTVRLKLDEAQVNGIYVQVCWSLGFTRQRKQFEREVWRASIPRADSLIPKVKFLSRGDNKDTYAVQTSFKRVLGTLRFYSI